MRVIEKVTEAEMAAIFLRTEITSSHFATAYLMSLEYLPPQVSAIVGYSEKVAVWDME